MAAAERAKPSDPASHGSAIRSAVTDSERTAMPAPVRPRSTPSIAMPAIAPARTTLGSGVTSRTKPLSATTPAPTRARREPPMAATAPKASPTTIAQFAPDTAVRCDSDDSFIAASRSGATADVSPTASPGIRPAPGAGSPEAERMSRSRRSAAAASIPSGGAVTSTPREAMTARTARSPMGAARAVPRAWTAAPTSRCSGRSTSGGRTRIETSKSTASPTAPVSIRLARVSKTHSPVARFSTLPTIVACTTTARPPPRANPSAATREGCASATWDAAAAAAAVRSTTTTRACPRRPRRLRAARPRAAIATREDRHTTHRVAATVPAAAGARVAPSAAAHAPSATGASRRRAHL